MISLCWLSFLLFFGSTFLASNSSLAAPPNPYFFLSHQSGNPVEYSSDRMNQAPNLSSYKQYLSALDGCCFQRPTTILQPDGIEFVLAIKIDFSDQVGSRSGNQINEYLFADQGVSLKTYYREVSYDQMDVRPGPAEGIMPKKDRWVRAKHPMSYYGDGKHNVARYRELVREACQGIDDEINFVDYDRNKDGIVDHLFIVHAGDDEASTFTGTFGPNIWSVLVPSINTTFDGVKIDTAVLVAEEPSFKHPHLGIYFHEFFHDFGAPDVYGSPMIDARDHKWGLMGMYGPYQGQITNGLGDGMNPSHIIGYLKWDFDARPEHGRKGWLKPKTITGDTLNYSLPCIELKPSLLKIEILDRPDEFFLLENRYTRSGAEFDRYLPESGLLIWHIDESKVRSAYAVDAAQQIWLEDPNDPNHIGQNPTDPSQRNMSYISDGAAYSADDQQTSFMQSTNPSSQANDGTPTGVSITNISREGTIMSMNFSTGDTYEPNNNFSTAFPLEIGQSYPSFIFSSGDIDYYRFQPIDAITLLFQLTDIPENHNYQLQIYDQNQVLIAEGIDLGTSLSASRQVAYQAKAGQILYLVIRSESGFSQKLAYQVSIQKLVGQAGLLNITRMKIFPNPAHLGRTLTLSYTVSDFQTADQVIWEIYTIAGDLIHSDLETEVVGSGRFIWTVNGISAGVYIHSLVAQRNGESHQISGKIAVVGN